MKKIFILLDIMIMFCAVMSQDVIYLHNGGEIKAKVLNNYDNMGNVEFSQNGQINRISRMEVKLIQYADGHRITYVCSNLPNTNQSVKISTSNYSAAEISKEQIKQQPALEYAAQSESVLDDEDGGDGTTRSKAEIVAELNAIIIEINGKDYAKRKAKLEKFVANSQKTQDKLSSIRSIAPGCYDIAALALEMLKVTMDVTRQVEEEMAGYRKIMGTSEGITDVIISEKKIPFKTFQDLIIKSALLLTTVPNLKGELMGPTAIVGVPMLGFATAVIPNTTQQLTLMIKAAKALRELKRAGI